MNEIHPSSVAAPGGDRLPITLVVLTYNEEVNIRHAIESVKDWIGDIVIVDSFSTDGTLDICRSYNARIYQHPFDNQAKQFNWMLDNVPIHTEWILRLDADEMVSPELAAEFRRRVPGLAPEVTGVYLRRRIYFMGRWMRHGGLYPMWSLRLFRRGKGRYEEITEEHLVLSEGRTVRFDGDFIDYNRKGLTFWVDKHNHWAVGEMLDTMAAMGKASLPPGTIRPSLVGTQEQRTRWLKTRVYARLPLFARAFAYFAYRYFLRGGFLDGPEGLIFHTLQGLWYRFLVDAKIYEVDKFGLQHARTRRQYTGSKPWE